VAEVCACKSREQCAHIALYCIFMSISHGNDFFQNRMKILRKVFCRNKTRHTAKYYVKVFFLKFLNHHITYLYFIRTVICFSYMMFTETLD